jgi:hypothetical protein
MWTTERVALIAVIACSMGVVLGMFAQSVRYRREFDAVYSLIDRKLGLAQEAEKRAPAAPASISDLDPARHTDTNPGLDSHAAELKARGFPGTRDSIPVITDKMTRAEAGLPDDTVEGPVVPGPVPQGLWPASDTLAPADPGSGLAEYQVFPGGLDVAALVDQLERDAYESTRRALVSG